jgi:hypothetical protein
MILFAGQSNAGGYGVAASVTNYPGIASAYPAVQYIEQGSGLTDPPVWVTQGPRDLQPRTTTIGGQLTGTFGVELSAMRDLDASTIDGKWFAAKFWIDGSGLENNWLNASYPTAGPQLMTQLQTFITAQLAAFNATLAGIVWIQGEKDGSESPDLANYGTNMASFFSTLRSAYGASVPIVIHRQSNNVSTTLVAHPELRSRQESHIAATSNAAITYGDDLPLRDTLHYSDDSYATMGVRVASALVGLISAATPPAPRWLAAGIPVVASSIQSATPAWPAHDVGDRAYLIVAGQGINNYTLSTAAGFTAVSGSPIRDSTLFSYARLQVWECVASSSAMASPTVADVASDDSKMAMIVVVRGSSATDAIASDATTGTASTTVTFPSVTSTVDNALILNIAAIRIDIGTAQASAWTNAALTDLTEHVDNHTATGAGCGIIISAGRKATAGATGSTTATLAAASTQARMTIAIKP